MRFARALAAHRRTNATDAVLGVLLAFVAGAINAGGFMAIGKYTSHMTGIISAIADDLALGVFSAAATGAILLLLFTAGASCSAILINWGRRNARTLQYALPLGLESVLLLCFGTVGLLGEDNVVFAAAPLLCFIMGLQNATITKISGARVRTTHVTGMVTDIGIEFGKLAYWHRSTSGRARRVRADRGKLHILLSMVGMFLLGGIFGAFSYGFFGLAFSIPLAGVLILLVLPVVIGNPAHGRKVI